MLGKVLNKNQHLDISNLDIFSLFLSTILILLIHFAFLCSSPAQRSLRNPLRPPPSPHRHSLSPLHSLSRSISPRRSKESRTSSEVSRSEPSTFGSHSPPESKIMVLPGFSKLGSFLIEKKYAEGKSANELDAIEKDRLKQYGTMCSLDLANMFWNGKNNVLKELNVKKNEDWILNSIIFFTCSLVLMMIGLVASTFPESAPYPTFSAGWGAWAAVLCMLGSYHLDLVPFFASPMDALISMIVTSTVFTLYWSYGAQDPWFVHLLGRFVWWIIQCIWNLIVSLYNKVAAAVGKLFKRSPMTVPLNPPGQQSSQASTP